MISLAKLKETEYSQLFRKKKQAQLLSISPYITLYILSNLGAFLVSILKLPLYVNWV